MAEHDVSKFEGELYLEVDDVQTLVEGFANEPVVGQALEKAIADGIAGIDASMVNVVSVTQRTRRLLANADHRRLYTSASNVNIKYDVVVPTNTANNEGITANTFVQSESSLTTTITEALTTTFATPITVTSVKVDPPTLTVVKSNTIETTTIEVTGTMVFNAVISSQVSTQAAVVQAMALEFNLPASAITVTATMSRRLGAKFRRLANTWSASWKAILVPSVAASLIQAVRNDVNDAIAFASLAEQLKTQLVIRGASQTPFSLTSLSLPSYTAPTPIANPCGTNYCSLGKLPFAPDDICAYALTCTKSEDVCCTNVMSLQNDGTPAPSASAGTIAGIAIGAVAFLLLCFLCIFIGARRWKGIQPPPKIADRDMPKVQPAQENDSPKESPLPSPTSDANFTMSTTGTTPRKVERSHLPTHLDNISEDGGIVRREVSNNSRNGTPRGQPSSSGGRRLRAIEGEWRMYMGGHPVPGGNVCVEPDGYVLYDNVHVLNQDLVVRDGRVSRQDGWQVNHDLSSDEELLWYRRGEASVVWKRVKSVMDFSVGDTVAWTRESIDVRLGTQGVVVGIMEDQIRVKFPPNKVMPLPVGEVMPIEELERDERLRALLDGLNGDWRLCHGEEMFPGVVSIGVAGHTLYSGQHWPEQNLLVVSGRIVRGDGWALQMELSNEQELKWFKRDEGSITWKRIKAADKYKNGDRVAWLPDTPEMPNGLRGSVVGTTKTRVRVKFPRATLDVPASDIVPAEDPLAPKDPQGEEATEAQEVVPPATIPEASAPKSESPVLTPAEGPSRPPSPAAAANGEDNDLQRSAYPDRLMRTIVMSSEQAPSQPQVREILHEFHPQPRAAAPEAQTNTFSSYILGEEVPEQPRSSHEVARPAGPSITKSPPSRTSDATSNAASFVPNPATSTHQVAASYEPEYRADVTIPQWEKRPSQIDTGEALRTFPPTSPQSYTSPSSARATPKKERRQVLV